MGETVIPMKTAVLMAGQGAQFPGMGKELSENSSLAGEIFAHAEALHPGVIHMLTDPEYKELNDTSNTQIAVFLMDYVCAELLKQEGIEPDVYAGFSLGEIAALAAAEAMSFEDAIRLVTFRGRFMQECAIKYPGSMVAVIRPDEKKLSELCIKDQVYMANISSAQQISVSGSRTNMDAFREDAKKEGLRFVDVAVSGAFHTPLMREASEKLGKILAETSFSAPKVPVYSDVTAEIYPKEAEGIRKLLQQQIISPVHFRDILHSMQRSGVENFVECGPGHTLTGFVRKTLKNVRYCNVCDSKTLSEATKMLKENENAE